MHTHFKKQVQPFQLKAPTTEVDDYYYYRHHLHRPRDHHVRHACAPQAGREGQSHRGRQNRRGPHHAVYPSTAFLWPSPCAGFLLSFRLSLTRRPSNFLPVGTESRPFLINSRQVLLALEPKILERGLVGQWHRTVSTSVSHLDVPTTSHF